MSAVSKLTALLFLLYSATTFTAATWCVVRSDASQQALLEALNYACGGGADCAPIQSSGLCYLPNTVQAHASYAFNSYYQRRGNAPDSCTFGGTATIAATDPSYGSCVYPSSPRTAGGMTAPRWPPAGTTSTPDGTTPTITEPPPPPATTAPLYNGGVGTNPIMGPIVPNTPTSNVPPHVSKRTTFFLLVFLSMFHIM